MSVELIAMLLGAAVVLVLAFRGFWNLNKTPSHDNSANYEGGYEGGGDD